MTSLYRDGLFNSDSKVYKWWLLGVVMMVTFMAVLDVTIVNVALPDIIHYYKGNIGVGEWISTAYLLANVMFLPIAGWFAMRYGFKSVLLFGVLVFTVGSVWCRFAWSMEALIIGRFIEGVGSGILMPVGMALVTRHFQGAQRSLALGFWAMASAASVSLGPILGGFLVSGFNWYAIFEINIPIGIITTIAIILIQREWREPVRKRFDIKGFALLWIWLPLSLLLISNLSHWPIWVNVFAALAVFGTAVMFVRHSLRADSPVVNLKILKDGNFGLSMIIMSCYGMALYAGNYLLPLFVERSLDYSAWHAGLIFLPVGIIQGIIAPLSGWFSRYVGNKRLLLVGVIGLLIYLGISAMFDTTSPSWIVTLSLYFRGFGIGLSFTALNTLSLQNLDQKDMADASSISNTIRQFSGSIGIAILTIVLSHNAKTFANGIHIDFLIVFFVILLSIIPILMIHNKK